MTDVSEPVKENGRLQIDDAQTGMVRNEEHLSAFVIKFIILARNRNGVTGTLSCGNELPKGFRDGSRR